MSFAKKADRFALEIGYAPLVAFAFWHYGLFDWRFWLLLVCGVWLTYWVKRQVADQIGRSRG